MDFQEVLARPLDLSPNFPITNQLLNHITQLLLIIYTSGSSSGASSEKFVSPATTDQSYTNPESFSKTGNIWGLDNVNNYNDNDNNINYNIGDNTDNTYA